MSRVCVSHFLWNDGIESEVYMKHKSVLEKSIENWMNNAWEIKSHGMILFANRDENTASLKLLTLVVANWFNIQSTLSLSLSPSVFVSFEYFLWNLEFCNNSSFEAVISMAWAHFASLSLGCFFFFYGLIYMVRSLNVGNGSECASLSNLICRQM